MVWMNDERLHMSPVHKRLQMSVVRVDRGLAVLSMPLTEDLRGYFEGSIHGGMLATFADAAVEIGFVPFKRLAFVKPAEIVGAEFVFVPLLFDRLAGDLAAIDEDATLRSFEENAVRAADSLKSSLCGASLPGVNRTNFQAQRR